MPHLWPTGSSSGWPRRLRPDTSPHTLRIPSHDGHPVLRSAAKSGFRFTLAVSSFRLRARLGFSIPSLFSGQRDVNPAFGYGAPHLSAGGTSTLLNNALLSAHYRFVRLPTFVHHRRTSSDFPMRPKSFSLWENAGSPGSRARCFGACSGSATARNSETPRDNGASDGAFRLP